MTDDLNALWKAVLALPDAARTDNHPACVAYREAVERAMAARKAKQ